MVHSASLEILTRLGLAREVGALLLRFKRFSLLVALGILFSTLMPLIVVRYN